MKKVLIWGTGKMAQELMNCGINAEIIGFIQTSKSVDTFMRYPVFSVADIPSTIDFILVANTYSDQVYDICQTNNISLDKVIFLHKGIKTKFVEDTVLFNILGDKNLTRYKAEYGILGGTFFDSDKELYSSLNKRKNFTINEDYLWPILKDKYTSAGVINNYFWQDLWAAKHIISSGVENHFDIGSRLDGFIAHLLAANIDVTMIDVREFPGEIEGLHTIVDDATLLHQIPDESIYSMSALCSLEHFGLGRYGDPIDPEACFKCFENIQKKLAPGGKLYISVPIGRERVEFNAHRVFYASTIVECFHELKLIEISASFSEHIEYNIDIHHFDNEKHNGEYCYGLFYFEK